MPRFGVVRGGKTHHGVESVDCEKRCAGQDVDTLFGLRYVDRFEKRSDEWRIATRRIVAEWNRHDDVNAPGFGPEFLRGQKVPDDPVYDR